MESKYFADLKSLADAKYGKFQEKLLPDLPNKNILGVRMPALRKLAKEIRKEGDYEDFLDALPHKYYDENQLHALLINEIREFDVALNQVEKFLPHVDNWATCDSIANKAFKMEPDRLLPHINRWIKSNRTYTIRFGIGCFMRYFLGDNFKAEHLSTVGKIKSESYYVNMGIAWFFATALGKHWDETIEFLKDGELSPWVMRKTIQKGIESFRVSQEQKSILREMRAMFR